MLFLKIVPSEKEQQGGYSSSTLEQSTQAAQKHEQARKACCPELLFDLGFVLQQAMFEHTVCIVADQTYLDSLVSRCGDKEVTAISHLHWRHSRVGSEIEEAWQS
eukprot:171089-Pelagomonas_calceolata.AAC.6